MSPTESGLPAPPDFSRISSPPGVNPEPEPETRLERTTLENARLKLELEGLSQDTAERKEIRERFLLPVLRLDSHNHGAALVSGIRFVLVWQVSFQTFGAHCVGNNRVNDREHPGHSLYRGELSVSQERTVRQDLTRTASKGYSGTAQGRRTWRMTVCVES